jgi:DNA ligase-1
MKAWPQLYAIASTGKVKTWRIAVEESNDGAVIKVKHGYIDGKLTEQVKLVKSGKNIGKANETTPVEQAISEAASAFQEKLDKKYITEIPNGNNLLAIILPMLAQDYRKRAHDIVFPAYVQPKFNGVRCLAHKVADDKIEFISRKGKSYNNVCEHILCTLLPVMEVGEILDGELYHHDWSFQKILRTVKKQRPWGQQLQYHIYDMADESMTFTERLAKLVRFEYEPTVIVVPTLMAENDEAVKSCHNMWASAGFEGVIIRNAIGKYKFDYRSKDLQKYKEFIDKEFQIVGFDAEPVVDKKAIIFICKLENGNTFSVRPRGSILTRINWYAEGETFIGKQLTVRYQELSEDSVPIFPVGIAVRDYE